MANTIQKESKIIYLQIGQNYENLGVQKQFDVSEWTAEFPDAHIYLLFKRPGEEAAAPVNTTLDEDGILTWTVSNWETGIIGIGFAEIRAIDSSTGLVKKSHVIPCSIEASVTDEDAAPDYPSWVDRMLQFGENVDSIYATLPHELEEGIASIQQEAQEQTEAIEQKGITTRASIPADYTTLSDEVTDLKSALNFSRFTSSTYKSEAFTCTAGKTYIVRVVSGRLTLATRATADSDNVETIMPMSDAGTVKTFVPSQTTQYLRIGANALSVFDIAEYLSPIVYPLYAESAMDKMDVRIDSLTDGISSSFDYVNYFDDLIMGSVDTTTGEVQTSTNRCVNASIRSADKAISCSCDSGYSLYVLQYNDDQSVTVLTTWVQNYTIPANARVRIMVRKNDNTKVSVKEIIAHVSGVYSVIPEIETRMTTLENNVSDIDDCFSPDKNLFDGAWERGSFANDGREIVGTGAYRTGYISVNPNTVYTLQNEANGTDPYFVGLIMEYGADRTFLYRHANTTTFPYTFTTQPGTAYIRFRTKDVASVTITGAQNAKYMLHMGEGKVDFLQYGQFSMSDGFFLDIEDGVFDSFNLACNYFDYGKYAKSNDGTEGSRFDADNLTAQDVYDAYDALVSGHSDYVSKKDLGMDESDTYHVYQYTFMPPVATMINSSTGTAIDELPCMFQKIIITSGTHGDGEGGDKTDSIISVYNLMKALCDNYKGNPALSFIRMNVEIIVIPCVNPWGITNKSRYNSNNVDINRNFDAGWYSGRPNAGSSAASEAETQIMQNLFDNNTDAVAHVEVHTRGGNTWAQTSTTFISETLKTSKLKYVMQTVTAYLKNKFGATGNVNIDMLDLGMIIDYSKKVGIESTLLECAFMAAQSEPALHSKEIDRRNTEFVADTVIKSLQWFIFHPKLTVS